jgi:hypothetical protein
MEIQIWNYLEKISKFPSLSSTFNRRPHSDQRKNMPYNYAKEIVDWFIL